MHGDGRWAHAVCALWAVVGGEGGSKSVPIVRFSTTIGNVDRWSADARSHGGALGISDIPFPESRDYVSRVLHAQVEYRRKYAAQLGYA